jgi:hypothetical protein
MEEWENLEWNTIRQRRKHLRKVCERKSKRTITPLKNNNPPKIPQSQKTPQYRKNPSKLSKSILKT